MKQIYNYIIEKLHLNKDIKIALDTNELIRLENYVTKFINNFENSDYINDIKFSASRSLTETNEIRLSINIGSSKPSFMNIDVKDKFLNQLYEYLDEYASNNNYKFKDPIMRISTTIYTFKEI